MTKEEILKYQIETQYGSVFHFAEEIGVPYSTIRNIFTRGLDGIGVATAVKICRALHLDLDALMSDSLSVRPNPMKDAAWKLFASHPALLSLSETDLDFLTEVQNLSQEQKQTLIQYLRFLSEQNQSAPSSDSPESDE